jgi:uncharacterized repeat protein (TIGR01451 family)
VSFTGLSTNLGRGERLRGVFEYPAPASGTIAVNSSITTSTPETTTANNTASGSTAFVPSPPDLTITKTHSGDFTQGQTGAPFTITVTNVGLGATLSPVVVADTLPDGLTATALSGPGWTCLLIALRCSRADALAAGASYPPITLTVDVAPDAPASMSNIATVSGGGETNTANNTATDPITVIQLPDLTIAKSHTGAFTAGDVGRTFTITVTNLGPGPTTGVVTVTDTLPAGLTATAIAGPGWICVLPAPTCTRSDVLAPAASYPPITLTVNVAPNAPTSMSNVATVSGGGETNTTNNTATDPIAVTLLADLTIAKGHTGAWVAGDVGRTFTITVTNLGPGPTTGLVTVTDTVPAGLTATAIAGPGWTCVLATLTCTRSDVLAAAASYPPITLTVNVAAMTPPVMSNVATVSGGGETNTTNNTATDPVSIAPVPDLTIAKSHAGTFEAGQSGETYTITVTNQGAGSTTGVVTVTDTLPAGLTPTTMSGPSWICDLLTLTCTRSDVLASGASYPPITITVNVSLTASGLLVNLARVSGGGELNTSNNLAVDPAIVAAVPDLAITKSHAGTFKQGQVGAQYTIVARNVGTGSTSGLVTVSDTLPTGLTATAIAGPGWACVLATLTCTRSDALAPGASYPPITLTVSVSLSGTDTLVNQTSVSGGGDANPANNTATDPTTITLAPDLALTKTSSGDFFRGGTGTYTIVVANVGPAPSSGEVTVLDILPAGVTATSALGPGWACTLAPLACTRSDALVPGASYPPITIEVKVALTAGGTLTNVATVSGGGDTNLANNTDGANRLIPIPPDLTIAKTHSGEFVPGQSATYTIVVTNISSVSQTQPITVGDILPPGLTATAISGSGWSCSLTTLLCSRSDGLAAGASYPPITVTVDVALDATGTLTNYAAVFSRGDADVTNNVARDVVGVAPVAIPTLSLPALVFLAVVLALAGAMTVRRAARNRDPASSPRSSARSS